MAEEQFRLAPLLFFIDCLHLLSETIFLVQDITGVP